MFQALWAIHMASQVFVPLVLPSLLGSTQIGCGLDLPIAHRSVPVPALANPGEATPPSDTSENAAASSTGPVAYSFFSGSVSQRIDVVVVKFCQLKILHIRKVGNVFLSSKRDNFCWEREMGQKDASFKYCLILVRGTLVTRC